MLINIKNNNGFTIVELLVVIIIIGILASITMVAYTGITQKAIAATLRSDLKNSSTQLEMDKAANGDYPSTDAESNGGKGLPKSTDTIYQYTASGSNYCLSATSVNGGTMAYHISSIIGTIEEGVCNGHIAPGGRQALVWNQISAGDFHACAIASNNQAYCWGDNSSGQLGNNSTTNSLIPAAVDTSGVLSGKTIKSIDAGLFHACAIASDDQAYCWGDNEVGALGNNSTTNSLIPVAVDTSGVLSGKTIKTITGGDEHTCAIASDDQAYCWGANYNGQLGNNSTVDSLIPVAVDTSGVLSGKTIKSIDTRGWHTCAIASDNQAYCWGWNGWYGQLGNNSTTDSSIPVAVDTSGVLSGKTIKSIAGGDEHTCAIASDDQAYCWGDNSDGELGNNSTTDSSIPVAVDTSGVLSGKTIKSITTGDYHTCAIASDNQAYCWGHNYDGGLGNNSTANSSIPVVVDTSGVLSGKTIKSIIAGYDHTCVLASDDQAYCWGSNTDGKLGIGVNSSDSSSIPVAVNTSGVLSGKTIKSISAGGDQTCAIASDDQAYCWGYNYYGQLGNNSTTDSLIPVAVDISGVLSGKTIKSVAGGDGHNCAIASDDQAYCWGDNNHGQLGNNSTAQSHIPVAVNTSGVLSGKTIKTISASYYHICAIASDNQAYCWGNNGNGQLGNNSAGYSSSIPVAINTSGVLSGKTIKSIAGGGSHTCAIASDNLAYCWGYGGNGALGNNSTTQSRIPVAVNTSGVLSGKTIKSITAGEFHTCAIASDDQAYCWGDNGYGQLGNNSNTNSLIPVAVNTSGVLSGKTIKSIDPGNNHTCAIASDDQAYCWGGNGGALGNNSNTNSLIPVAVNTSGVLSGKMIKSITAGNYYTCAIAFDNQAYCWGTNYYGQLGKSILYTRNSLIPIAVRVIYGE